MAKRWGKSRNSDWLYFLCSKITVDTDCSHGIKRCLLFGRKSMTKIDTMLKSRYHFADKSPYGQSYGFSSSQEQLWELDHNQGWMSKSWCFWIVVLEKTLDNPLDCKEIKSVNPKGNEFWIFIGRTYAKAEASKLWPPDAKSQLIGKQLDTGKDWGQEEKGVTEDEMVAWHHQNSGHEFEKILRESEGQGRLACSSPWGCKKADTTSWMNNCASSETQDRVQ